MIRTKNIIQSIHEVPATWVFEYYAKLPILTGQRVAIKSIFSATDSDPSLIFYSKSGEYHFKDFSEGIGGDKVDFYRAYSKYKLGQELSNADAVVALIYTYTNYIQKNDYKKNEIIDEVKFTVQSFELRSWYPYDAKYWQAGEISSKTLEYFLVKPLKSLMVSNGIDTYSIKKGMTYGYFKKDASLYKTYAPLESKDKKFNNYIHYIHGWEQLRLHGGTVAICASLKDGMCVFQMYNHVDITAPTSENTYLTPTEIAFLKKHYKKVLVLFDNDEAGRKAAAEYKKRYDIDAIVVPLSKDIYQSIWDYSGTKEVRTYLDPYLL